MTAVLDKQAKLAKASASASEGAPLALPGAVVEEGRQALEALRSTTSNP